MKWKWTWDDIYKRVYEHKADLMNLIAATLQTQRAMIFDKEGAYNGREKWKPSQRALKKGGMTLSKSGALRRSIAPRNNGIVPGKDRGTIIMIEGTKVSIGTTLAYAAIHNYGGTIKHPGTRNGFGRGIRIRPHNIVIPKRPFLDYTSEDKKEVVDTLMNAMAALIDGD